MVYLGKTIKTSLHYGASPEIFDKAVLLRRQMTYAEKILWQELRRRNIPNLHFRRQHPIYQFIADFYCHQIHLVIELDGDVHDTNLQAERDINRSFIIETFDIKVIRFRNEDVYNRLEWVRKEILTVAAERIQYFQNKLNTNDSVDPPPSL